MSSKKIEFLADRRAALRGSENTLRVLRHLDAARIKLDKLQTTRRQLKLALEKSNGERVAALTKVAEITLLHNQQSQELRAAQILLDTQADQIEQFRSSIRRQRPRQADEDRPALTVLALEKVATRSAAAIATMADVNKPQEPTGFIKRIILCLRPSIG